MLLGLSASVLVFGSVYKAKLSIKALASVSNLIYISALFTAITDPFLSLYRQTRRLGNVEGTSNQKIFKYNQLFCIAHFYQQVSSMHLHQGQLGVQGLAQGHFDIWLGTWKHTGHEVHCGSTDWSKWTQNSIWCRLQNIRHKPFVKSYHH